MHEELIDLGVKLGYFTDYDGACAGVTMAWLSACLTDAVQEAKYARLIKKIVEEGPQLFDEIQRIQNKVLEKKSLTDEEKEYFQYLALYEQIVLYLSPSKYFELFGKFLCQSDIESISSIANSESLEQKGGLFVVYKEPGIYTQDELVAYLTEIAESVSPDVGPIALAVTSHHHEIGLIYTPMNCRWRLMDINQGEPKELSVKDVADKILDGFNIQPERIPRNKYTALTVHIITSAELGVRQLLKTSLQALKFRHVMTPALAKRVGAVGLLWMAAQIGDIDVVQSLLANGAAVNLARSNGVTPLYIAARNGHSKIVEALLANGAAVDQAKLNGATPLYMAAQNGHIEVVKALLAKGVSLNRAIDCGATALMIAAENGHLNVLQALLTKGARVNQPRLDGATPLFMAAQHGHFNVMQVLLTAGARLNVSDLKRIKKYNIEAYKVYKNYINRVDFGMQSVIDDLVNVLKTSLDVYYIQSHQERSMLFFQRRNKLFYGFIRQIKTVLDEYVESKNNTEIIRLIQQGCPFIGQAFQPLRERIDAELHPIELKIKGLTQEQLSKNMPMHR